MRLLTRFGVATEILLDLGKLVPVALIALFTYGYLSDWGSTYWNAMLVTLLLVLVGTVSLVLLLVMSMKVLKRKGYAWSSKFFDDLNAGGTRVLSTKVRFAICITGLAVILSFGIAGILSIQ